MFGWLTGWSWCCPNVRDELLAAGAVFPRLMNCFRCPGNGVPGTTKLLGGFGIE